MCSPCEWAITNEYININLWVVAALLSAVKENDRVQNSRVLQSSCVNCISNMYMFMEFKGGEKTRNRVPKETTGCHRLVILSVSVCLEAG